MVLRALDDEPQPLLLVALRHLGVFPLAHPVLQLLRGDLQREPDLVDLGHRREDGRHEVALPDRARGLRELCERAAQAAAALDRDGGGDPAQRQAQRDHGQERTPERGIDDVDRQARGGQPAGQGRSGIRRQDLAPVAVAAVIASRHPRPRSR